MLGGKMKRTVGVRLFTLLVWLACLTGLSVSATFLIGHAVYKKQSNDKDEQILAARKDNKFLSDKNIELQNSLQKLEDEYGNLEVRYKDLAASLVLAQHTAAVNTKSLLLGPPPIEQPLVREGEFAAELASAFNLTSLHDEAAGESYLASVNIMPKNGWISDYPVTPDIIAEVRDSAARSASSGNLQISETDAVGVVDNVSMAMNLPVKVNYESNLEHQSRSAPPPPEAYEYLEPSVVEDYYDDNKPPIVTYYPPPLGYGYLYDWVPWPFWWGGYRFGGFFILVDFDRNHHHKPFTNHITTANGTVSRINATTRASATANRQTGSGANTATTAGASAPQNLTSSGSALNTGRTIRDPGSATQNTERLTSPRGGPVAASRSPSHDGRTFKGAPSPRFSPGGGSDGGPKGGGGLGEVHVGGHH